MGEASISVVIPAYNAQAYLREAIESVLLQRYGKIEVIVVNDGSTDTTPAVLETFGSSITVLSQGNKGQSAARNKGIERAKGEFIGLMDADDIWPPDHTEILATSLLGNSSYDYARGMTQFLYSHKDAPVVKGKIAFLQPQVGACLYRRDVFTKAGLFDESLRTGEDIDFNLRLQESGCRELQIEHTTLFYRRHEDNLTNSADVLKQGQLQAFRKKIMRAKAKEALLYGNNPDAYTI